MQVQIQSLAPLIFPRSYQCALTFQDHRFAYLALLIRLSIWRLPKKHHNIPLRPLPLLSSHHRISLPARRPFQDHGTVPDLLRPGRRLSRERPMRPEEILALTGTLLEWVTYSRSMKLLPHGHDDRSVYGSILRSNRTGVPRFSMTSINSSGNRQRESYA
jgi:hypothetical protein